MRRILFSIGSLHVYGYGLMIAIGILAAYAVAEYRGKKKGLDPDRIWGLTLCCAIGGLACAKLLYYILDIREIIENPRVLLNFSNGFVVYGGIIGGILIGWLYSRRHQLVFLRYADLVLTSVALAQGFGRIGCFLAGCCYGVETDGPCAVVFTHSDFAPNGVPLVPTQLISSGLDFLNFLALVLIAKRKPKDGVVTACYLIFYSIGRFAIEFFRGDLIRGSIGPLSTSQFISIFVAIAGVIFLMIVRKGKEAAA